jgi:histidinol-phosphate/aromatic aminotransferase/cobyric acid decarboxylase-like protein/adenosyl cobinamide kinase/adenosyl cobinamide phosphate guanylyltransferase
MTLVLGGQKSGKSSLGARRASASGRSVVVVTPAIARDPEFAARIARHQADRPDHWTTIETFDLVEALDAAGPDAFVLVDALDTWLAESLERAGLFAEDGAVSATDLASSADASLAAIGDFVAAVAASAQDVLVIAGQPGLGVHAGGPAARAYVDIHGLAVQELSAAADEVLLVIGGRAVPLPAADAPSGDGDHRPHGADDTLREHGDTQVPGGMADLAVNVEEGPPSWLAERLAATVPSLARYPDDRAARAAIATRHGRSVADCLPTDGAAEAFWLLAHVLRPRLAVCVQPSFTEPEAALRSAGVHVQRVFRDAADDWMLNPERVPAAADLVVVGRPDNPTGALDPVQTLESLARPGRTLVVDEAFADFLPDRDDADGIAVRGDLPGLVSIRSLTKLWGLAGLRVGYLVGPADLVRRFGAARQPWSCNSLALTAIEALTAAEEERRARGADVAARRDELVAGLRTVGSLHVWASPANFVLIQGPVPRLRDRLLDFGLAARRADTFPGLDDTAIRVAVRDRATSAQLIEALRTIVKGHSS